MADDAKKENSDLVFDRPKLMPPKEKGGMWELAEDWTLCYKGEVYTVPAGFKTDGASIPRFLWRVCGTPLDVPRVYAALVHDWLYSGGVPNAARLHDAAYSGTPVVTRAEADALYRDLLIALGVSRVKAYTEWAALRLCGGGHWLADDGGVSGKSVVCVAFALILVSAIADIYRDGPVRDFAIPAIKIKMIQEEKHTWRISEDAPLFAARFADVYYPEYLLNYAEQKELAKAVAKAVADFFGSTNAVRIAHWERPEPASTNVIDVLISNLNAELVTDEIVPTDFRARCADENENTKEGSK